jgi:hypothetical protein
MIGPIMSNSILRATQEYWAEAVSIGTFRAIASGKEIGHRIADYVDEKTTELLEARFPAKHELDASGRPRPRSMGDVWLLDNGIYNPVNVKAGEAGKSGQPNMVSLTKLIDALLKEHIDSYYLLIVKMRIQGTAAADELPGVAVDPGLIVPNVYFVDMLDYLNFITFDAGPGQAMLRERQFYQFCDAGLTPPNLGIADKVSRLVDLLEDGDRRLIENRRRKMERLRRDVDRYVSKGTHKVRQEGLSLG